MHLTPALMCVALAAAYPLSQGTSAQTLTNAMIRVVADMNSGNQNTLLVEKNAANTKAMKKMNTSYSSSTIDYDSAILDLTTPAQSLRADDEAASTAEPADCQAVNAQFAKFATAGKAAAADLGVVACEEGITAAEKTFIRDTYTHLQMSNTEFVPLIVARCPSYATSLTASGTALTTAFQSVVDAFAVGALC